MIILKVRDQILLPRLHYYYYKIFYPVRFVGNFICILAFTTAVDIRRTVLMLLRGIMSFGHFLTLPSTLSLKKSCLFFHLYFTWLGCPCFGRDQINFLSHIYLFKNFCTIRTLLYLSIHFIVLQFWDIKSADSLICYYYNHELIVTIITTCIV